jgi:hypothetical protein
VAGSRGQGDEPSGSVTTEFVMVVADSLIVSSTTLNEHELPKAGVLKVLETIQSFRIDLHLNRL